MRQITILAILAEMIRLVKTFSVHSWHLKVFAMYMSGFGEGITFSAEATLPKVFSFPYAKGSTLKGMHLLPCNDLYVFARFMRFFLAA